MVILGLNCCGHEAAACLLVDGKPIALGEEERFNREKHTSVYPYHSIAYCLREAHLTLDDVDQVAFFLRPWVWIGTQVRSGLRNLPTSLNLLRGGNSAYPIKDRIREMLSLKQILIRNHGASHPRFDVHYIDHHLAHAASAYYVSGYDESAILTIDGWGDRGTTTIASGRGNCMDKILEVPYPHSLGGLYSAVTEYLGFRSNSDEYKVMGMAAYGQPEYYDFFKDLIQFTKQGGFRLDLRYLSYHTHGHRRWYSQDLVKKLGPSRVHKDEITARHKTSRQACRRSSRKRSPRWRTRLSGSPGRSGCVTRAAWR